MGHARELGLCWLLRARKGVYEWPRSYYNVRHEQIDDSHGWAGRSDSSRLAEGPLAVTDHRGEESALSPLRIWAHFGHPKGQRPEILADCRLIRPNVLDHRHPGGPG